MVKPIRVIGKLKDLQPYRGQPGYDTFTPPDYDHDKNIEWLQDAISQGDWIQAVSDDVTGVYSEEHEILSRAMCNGKGR